MIPLRRAGWLVPAALGALSVTLIVAVIVARTERPSRALLAATPGIVNGGQGTPPEIAAINAQLAQIAALRAGALYGPGLTHVVPAPVASLRPVLGEEWRELGTSIGRVYVRPTGKSSHYFEVSAVVVAEHGPARLEMLTSEGQKLVEPIGTGPFQLINAGPLLAPAHGGVGLAFTSLEPQGGSHRPSLILSPLQAEYLAPGEWVTSMPALAEIGPGGRRGVYLASGSTTRFAMTPGVRGDCNVVLQGASAGGAVQVTITVGSEVRSATVGPTPSMVYVGHFSNGSEVLSLAVSTTAGKSRASLFVSNMRFVASAR
jgi:hypothetical protein